MRTEAFEATAGLREDHELRVAPEGASEMSIGGQELAPEALRECHVGGVVRGDVPPQVEHPREGPLMSVPSQREIAVVGECLLGTLLRERPARQSSTKTGDHLHVAERRHVQVEIVLAQDLADRPGSIGPEQVFEERRGVGDDDPQEAPRDARSSWINSAAGRPSLTRGLASILSKTSAAGGLATSRSRSSWM